MPRTSQNLLTRLSKDMLTEFYEKGFWKDASVYDYALCAAQRSPHAIALRDDQCALTYAQLVQIVDLVATDLDQAGLRPGDRVAAWLPSRLETAVLFLACSRQGYVFCPSLHRSHTVAEIIELLHRMSPKAFVAEEGYGADADRNDLFASLTSVQSILRTTASGQGGLPIFKV